MFEQSVNNHKYEFLNSREYNNKMNTHDVESRADLEQIIKNFYAVMLDDPIVGFIFTDVAKIDLASHLPLIVNFWSDIVFGSQAGSEKLYTGNTLRAHLELSQKLALKPGHFTRWLYLFTHAVQENHAGKNASLMIARAELVAKSISAAINDSKKSEMNLVLPS